MTTASDIYRIFKDIKERTKLPIDINRSKLWHVVYKYGDFSIRESVNKGWGIIHVIKTNGSKDDIPEVCRIQDEIHYTYTVEADSEEDAIKVAESLHKLPEGHPDKYRGLVFL